jgi:hypothetical protein
MRKRGPGPAKEAALSQQLQHHGRAFRSSSDVIEFLESVGDNVERYNVQAELLGQMLKFHNHASDMIEEVYTYIKKDGAFLALITHDQFNAMWSNAEDIVSLNAGRRNKQAEARNFIESRWDREAVAWLAKLHEAAYWLTSIRPVSAQHSLEAAATMVNRAFVQRLSKPRKGVSTQKTLQPHDFTTAKEAGMVEEVTRDEMRRFGLRKNEYGFLEEGLLQEIEEVDLAREAAQHFPSPAREIGGGSVADPGTAVAGPGPQYDFEFEVEDDVIDSAVLSQVGRELQGREQQSASEGQGGSGSEEGEEERPAKRKRTDPGSCGCSSDVAKSWKVKVEKIRPYEMRGNLSLLGEMVEFQTVCYPHAKAMGAHMGLRVKQLNASRLKERLSFIYEHRHAIGALKTSKDTYKWFRMANRPARASDALGPYKFVHNELPVDAEYDQQALRSWIAGLDSAAWDRDGSVNVNLFGWWFETRIGNIVLAEYEAYRHHLREINGKSNYGWLRNMFYSIGQQLMRQDPKYYAAYAALRPDKQWRLVSYPYYAKYAVKGENTYFRHIDLNIPDLIGNARGSCMIQGSVSLDDEDESNCTVILPGMQHKLVAWWKRVVARGQETNGFVHRITEQMFTEEDAKILGTNWKRVPCKRGEVRITLPHLPHGADGPSTGTRRTMLPWLVGLQDDLTTLEVVEGGTWDMLAESHRDMVSPRATPSGLANRYGAPPYRFPAAVEVTGLGPLSDALVCRRRWDSHFVLRDRDIMLRGDRAQAEAYVAAWREKAEAAAIEAFELFKSQEKQAFGEKSYFYHLDRFQQHGIPIPEMEPDEDEGLEDNEAEEEAGRDASGFAEAGIDEST